MIKLRFRQCLDIQTIQHVIVMDTHVKMCLSVQNYIIISMLALVNKLKQPGRT